MNPHLDYRKPDFALLSLVLEKVDEEEKHLIAEVIQAVSCDINTLLSIQPSKPALPIHDERRLHELAQGEQVNPVFQLLQID